jgi:hypothetical protein
VFVRVLERQDLTADDRIEAMARRGFAQFNLADLDAAEKTFRRVFAYKQQIEAEERLATDFYLAFSSTTWPRSPTSGSGRWPCGCPSPRWTGTSDQKASLLLQAQRGYIETIKFGNPGWASAAGFQVGSLYEELYDSFMNAPGPQGPQGGGPRGLPVRAAQEDPHPPREVDEVAAGDLLMIERLGVNTDWARSSKLAYAQACCALLDPKGAPEEATRALPHDQAAPAAEGHRAPGPEKPAGTQPTDKPHRSGRSCSTARTDRAQCATGISPGSCLTLC